MCEVKLFVSKKICEVKLFYRKKSVHRRFDYKSAKLSPNRNNELPIQRHLSTHSILQANFWPPHLNILIKLINL